MVEGSRGENHGELVGPLGGVAPATLGLIPEMAACQKAHHPLWEALPHRKTKVHLICGKTAVGIEAEDSISTDGTVWEEAVTDLQWKGGEGNSATGTLSRLSQ